MEKYNIRKKTSYYYGRFEYECVIPIDLPEQLTAINLAYKLQRRYYVEDIHLANLIERSGVMEPLNDKCVLSKTRSTTKSKTKRDVCVYSRQKKKLEAAVNKLCEVFQFDKSRVQFNEIELIYVPSVKSDVIVERTNETIVLKNPKHKFRIFLKYEYVIENRTKLSGIFDTYSTQFFPGPALSKYLNGVSKYAPISSFFDVDDDHLVNMLGFIFEGFENVWICPIIKHSDVMSYQSTQECADQAERMREYFAAEHDFMKH